MDKIVVTISREYGSGGSAVGKLIAESLKIPYYDKEIFHQMSRESGIQPEIYDKFEEEMKSENYYFQVAKPRFMGTGFALGEISLLEKMYEFQKTTIEELAKDSCVIVGRCANDILKGKEELVSFFITADMKDKIERAIQVYHEPREGIENILLEMDRKRSNYHEYFTNVQWGSVSEYDILINRSKIGIEQTAELVQQFIRNRIKK